MKKFHIIPGIFVTFTTPMVAIACESKVAQANCESKLNSELAKLQDFQSYARIDDSGWYRGKSPFNSNTLRELNHGDEITSIYLELLSWSRPYSYGANKPLKEPLNSEIFNVVLKKPINQNKEIIVTIYLRSWDKKYMRSKDVTILFTHYSNG